MYNDSHGSNATNLTYLRVSLGEKVSQHEMTLCDFWLREYLSWIQGHDLPKINYANMTIIIIVT